MKKVFCLVLSALLMLSVFSAAVPAAFAESERTLFFEIKKWRDVDELQVDLVSTVKGLLVLNYSVSYDPSVLEFIDRTSNVDQEEAGKLIGAMMFFSGQTKDRKVLQDFIFKVLDPTAETAALTVTITSISFADGTDGEAIDGVRSFTSTVSLKRDSGDSGAGNTAAPAMDTDKAKEKDGCLYAARGLTAGELLKAAGAGASLKTAKGAAVNAGDALASGMVLTKANGSKVTVVVKGDADGDGNITASDARYALRTAVKLEQPADWQLKACSVEGKESVSAADARAILRTAVKLQTLPLV